MPQIRPLEGIPVGVSISEAEDLASAGFIRDDINLITVELCRRLLALGAQIVVGYRWQPGGIMEQVTRFAQAYHMESGASGAPIVHNVMAWPDKASLSEFDREQLKDLVKIYEPEEPLERAAALTAMRRRVMQIAKGRICLSGKTMSYEGSMPGLIEEAFLSIEQEQPVYISAMMGGAATALIEWIRGRSDIRRLVPPAAQIPERIRDLIEGSPDRRHETIARLCRLHPNELEELFTAQNLDTVLQLSTRGMCRFNGTQPQLMRELAE